MSSLDDLTPWQPGQSGNPGGRSLLRSVRESCGENGDA